jgi:hypothetical protein
VAAFLRSQFGRFIQQLILAVVGYEALVIGGIALFMAGGMLLGYLPYTDRPGPGWYGSRQTIRELPMIWQWLRLNPWAPPIYAAAIFLLMRVLSLVPRLPRMVVRIAGSLIAAAVAVLWVAATGWYFSLSLSVQWAALGFAVAYGAWFLPRVLYGAT